MLPRPVLAVPLLVLGLTAACGGNDPASAPEPTVVETTPTPTPSETATPTPTPTPTEGSGDQVGNGDADETDGPATAGGGICGELGADEIGAVLGATVRGRALSGVLGCSFTQTDYRAYGVIVTDKPYTSPESMTAALDEATSAVEGAPETLAGIGTEAFVVTGTMFGGSDVQASGAVHVGARVVSVQLNQEKGIARAQVRGRLVALLELVVDQAR